MWLQKLQIWRLFELSETSQPANSKILQCAFFSVYLTLSPNDIKHILISILKTHAPSKITVQFLTLCGIVFIVLFFILIFETSNGFQCVLFGWCYYLLPARYNTKHAATIRGNDRKVNVKINNLCSPYMYWFLCYSYLQNHSYHKSIPFSMNCNIWLLVSIWKWALFWNENLILPAIYTGRKEGSQWYCHITGRVPQVKHLY